MGVTVIPIFNDEEEETYGVVTRVTNESKKEQDATEETYDPSRDPRNYPDKRLEITTAAHQSFTKLDIP